MLASVLASPTLITVTLPPFASTKPIAFDKATSSYGLTIYCTPAELKTVLLSEKVIFEVVSGTLLTHTNIFIMFAFYVCTNLKIKFCFLPEQRPMNDNFLCLHSNFCAVWNLELKN